MKKTFLLIFLLIASLLAPVELLASGSTTFTGWIRVPNRIYTLFPSDKVVIGGSASEFRLTIDNDGGIIARGVFDSGDTLTTSGAGTRFIWYPRKAALRAGRVTGIQWDDANIGSYSVAFGQNSRAISNYSGVLSGQNNDIRVGAYSVIVGGQDNYLDSDTGGAYRFIGGGQNNVIDGNAVRQSIVGGFTNIITGSSTVAFIGGGSNNTINTGTATVIVGGSTNTITQGSNSFIGGGASNTINTSGSNVVIVGGQSNSITDATSRSGIVAGQSNTISANASGILSGTSNSVSAINAAIVSGTNGSASGAASFIGSGYYGLASGEASFVGGGGGGAAGTRNTASGARSVVVGGQQNTAAASFSSILGGQGSVIGASSLQSQIMGSFCEIDTTATNATVIGAGINVTSRLVNNISNSIMLGSNSTVPTMTITGGTGVGTYGRTGIRTTTPNSDLHVSGSLSLAITTKAFVDSPYTVTANDYTILCNAVGGNIVINLPTSVGIGGRIYNIKKIDATANTCTIDAFGTQTIDNGLTAVLTTQYEAITIQNDGANWWVF